MAEPRFIHRVYVTVGVLEEEATAQPARVVKEQIVGIVVRFE